MKIILTSLASLLCICLLSQAASGFEPKISLSNTALVVLSDCDAGYLVKDCGNKEKITRTKSFAIKLKESLNMDSNDKKPKDTKTEETKSMTKKTTKDVKKKSEKPKKLDKDLKKKFEKIIKAKKTAKSSTQKTKHDTVKNSIGNVR